MTSSYRSIHPVTYVYLHGFASSPQSAKARDLGDRFRNHNIPLHVPDLNQNDFSHLTITRQIKQVAAQLPSTPTVVIGSSLGGLTAAWLGEQYLQIERLVLLAPAFQFLPHWLSRLGATQLQQWQKEQYLPVYHYGAAQSLPLHYEFIVDAHRYEETRLQRPIPTLILHGTKDDVIPVQASMEFASKRPWVTLQELDSDHSLGNVMPEIWQAIQAFCQV